MNDAFARAARIARHAATYSALLALGAAAAGAEWLRPDPSLRDALDALKYATRDTVGHGAEPARLDTLAIALLRVGRTDDAAKLFRRVLESTPGDDGAEAGLGKLALFAGRLDEADALLSAADTTDEDVQRDRFWLRLRREDYAGAAQLAEAAGFPGRTESLNAFAAEDGLWRIADGAPEGTQLFSRVFPAPLVKVKLNGQSVLMSLDTGASGLIVDEGWAKRTGVRAIAGEWPSVWNGASVVLRGALVQRFEMAGVRVENVPAARADLSRWSLEANPQGEKIAGVVGLAVLRRLGATLDYQRNRLVLRRTPAPPATGATRVPFEVWGENELMVRGSVAGGRRMWFLLETGLLGCGFAAPSEVLDEVGVKPGGVSKMVKSVGTVIAGRPWTPVTVPTVSIGAVVRDRVPGWSGAMDSGELWRHGVRRDGIVAGEFFRGRTLDFDWTKRELVIGAKP